MRRVKPAKNLQSAKLLLLRRRFQRYLPRHPARLIAMATGFVALAVCAVVLADIFDHGSRFRDAALSTSAALGFAVRDIEVEGREMTAREDILHVLDAGRGTPILGISPLRVKQQLETLPWVRSAAVERRLPDTLYIRLDERKPLALWQRRGKLMLIDHDGVVVTTEHLDRYNNLLLVVGEGAPRYTEDLIKVLESKPDLMKRITAAVRVGERRWNLQLDNGINVELPEANIADAWSHLADIDRDHGLLARNIEKVDLRLADRVVVKLTPEAAKPAAPVKRTKTAAKST
jgi:cell division protein FtsQ